MTISPVQVNSWQQLTMDQPRVVRITMTVGIMLNDGHAQVQFEAHDESADKLLALRSYPHLSPRDLNEYLPALLEEFGEMVRDRCGPFAD